jgi:hypothetical protein
MTRYTGYRISPLKTFLLGGLLALTASLPAHAQSAAEDTEAKKIAVAKAFCGEHGLLTKCIGQAPESCTTAMMPLVESCYGKKSFQIGEAVPESDEEGFKNCFWAEYLKRFSSRITYTDECTGSIEGTSPLAPLPPHLEAQTELLNPPNGQARAKGTAGF